MNLNSEYKQHVGEVLAEFIELYLDLEVQIAFDEQVLKSIGLSIEETKEVLDDTYGEFKLTKEHPMLKNILNILEKTRVLDEYSLKGFQQRYWI